jgi:hypothetical protein
MIDRALKVATTGRNWNTLNKLTALAAGLDKIQPERHLYQKLHSYI